MRIGELATAVGVTTRTVRHYHHLGLLPEPERLSNGDEKREGELDLVVGAQTSITLELAEPVTYLTFFGRPRSVRVVRFHADEPDVLVAELRQALTPA